MAAYRLGDFDLAAQCCAKAKSFTDINMVITAELFLAMSQYRLGHQAEARETLDDAVHTIEAKLPKVGQDDLTLSYFQNWVSCQVARHEAEALIGRAATTAPTHP